MKMSFMRRSLLPTPYSLIAMVLLVFFGPEYLHSQEVYDLERCIQTGLERNFALQVVRNEEEISSDNYTRGNAGMLPEISTTNQLGGTAGYRSSVTGGIDVDMTIFRGFQVKYSYEKLGVLKEVGGLNTQMSVENLVARIVSEYNYFLEQQTLYQNLAYAVSLSRERVRIDEERYLLGGASKLELLQSVVYLNADSSRLARQNEVLRSSEIRLNILMASENPGENIVLKDTIIDIDEGLVYEDLLQSTMKYNTSLQIASRNLTITELDYRIIASRSYPYLALSTGYGYSRTDGSSGPQSFHGLGYGVTLGMNIFDGFNERRERNNARIQIENRQTLYREVEQEVKADLLNIYFAYENNLRLLRLEEQNLEVARENLDIAMERYKLGNLAGLELREVQKSLLDAEERLISVKYLTKLAEISLLQMAGRIMDYTQDA
jgi:adhesin transport system outer membrane protein